MAAARVCTRRRYEAYFGLQQEPFSIAADPRLLGMSEKHREALAPNGL
jgi:hypothetical protein